MNTTAVLLSQHIALGLAVAGSPAPAGPTDEPAPVSGVDEEESARAIEAVFVHLDGLDDRSFMNAMRMRAPDLEIETADRNDLEPPANGRFVHVLVHPVTSAAETWDITVVTSTGKAFFREVEASPESAVRVVSTTTVTLLRGIEAGTVQPDAERPVPQLAKEPDSEPDPPEPPEPPQEPPVPPPRVELGLVVQGGLVAGFGPPGGVDSLAAGGGSLGLEIRFKGGGMVGLGARATTRIRFEHSIARLRIAGFGGYVWRGDRIEVLTAAFVSAEPWWLLADGAQVAAAAPSGDPSSDWLVGGGARLSPGYLIDVGRRSHLRLGFRLEFAGSAMPRGGVALVSVPDDDGELQSAFRLGGFEFNAGLELSYWWGVGHR